MEIYSLGVLQRFRNIGEVWFPQIRIRPQPSWTKTKNTVLSHQLANLLYIWHDTKLFLFQYSLLGVCKHDVYLLAFLMLSLSACDWQHQH